MNSGHVSCGISDGDGVMVRIKMMSSFLIAASKGFLCNNKRDEAGEGRGAGDGRGGGDGLRVKLRLLCLKV